MLDSMNGAGASRPGSETEGSRWHRHCFGFDHLVVRADDRVESPLSQGLCMKSIQASVQQAVAGEAHDAQKRGPAVGKDFNVFLFAKLCA